MEVWRPKAVGLCPSHSSLLYPHFSVQLEHPERFRWSGHGFYSIPE